MHQPEPNNPADSAEQTDTEQQPPPDLQQANDRLAADRDMLLQHYPWHWVAVGPNGLIAHAPTVMNPFGKRNHQEALGSIEEQIDQLENPTGRFALRFISPNLHL